MAINLTKGGRVSIGLSKVNVGLGWDPNQGSGQAFDLDASAFMIDGAGKLPQDEFFIFFNNKLSPCGSVKGADDDQSGSASDGGDDETIEIDLSKVDSRIEEIIIVITIHEAEARKQNFGQVRNSYIRILDGVKNEEIVKYELDEDFSIETAVEFGRLYKKNGEWKFQAVGVGYKEGLEFFLNKFG